MKRCHVGKAVKLSIYAFGLLGTVMSLPMGQVAQANTNDNEVSTRPYYGLYLSGRYANLNSDFDNAVAILTEAVRRNSEHGADVEPVLIGELRDSLLRFGDIEKAISFSEILGQSGSSDYNTRMLLLAKAVHAGDFATAQELAKKIPNGRVFNVIKNLLKGWIAVGLGNKQLALSEINQLKARFPGLYSFMKGQMLDQLGDHKGAEEAYMEPEGYVSPMQLPTVTFRAYIRSIFNQGRKDEVRDLVTEFITKIGDGPALSEDLRLLMEGKDLVPMIKSAEQGVGEAIYQVAQFLNAPTNDLVLDLTRVAEYLHPEHRNIKMSVAQYMMGNERFDEAVAVYDQVKDLYPFFWQSEIYKAEAIWEMGDKEKALDLLDDIASDRPSDLVALDSMARFYNRDQNYEDMAKTMDRLIGRINAPTHAHWGYYYLQGISYERLKEWPTAEKAFLKALELSPDEPDVLNYLGYTWVDKGLHLEKAQGMLRKAVDARRGSGAIADSLGWAYYKLGKYEDAVKLLERAVALDPNEAVIVEHLGDAYWQVGRKREARFQWNRAMKWPSEEVDVDAVREKLQKGL
ncbi:tetratricopeptide repeat protein [Curvivirga sp.]|uniref:tetratricopeptide repeat protein n=1 Tax=Curvivirga sp. TaxID=2856848 RepID=UPI003B58DB61